MIKLVYCITKKAGMSDEAFRRYWKDVHGPIGARIPGLRRLVQSHAVRDERWPGDYDGMAELWFDDLGALAAARETPEWEASTRDERNFVDPSRVAFFVSVEHEIVSEEGPR